MTRLLREDPPPPRKGGRRPTLVPDLLRIAYRPGQTRRLRTLGTSESARVLASELRNGREAMEGRPPGVWEFSHGLIPKGRPDAGKYGVWARFTPFPPETKETT